LPSAITGDEALSSVDFFGERDPVLDAALKGIAAP